jgi:hypothetical protein
MAMFAFGEARITDTPRGPRKAAEYALHLQCAWRLREDEAVLIGSSDLYTPTDPAEDKSNFDWDEPQATRRDVLMAELLKDERPLVVEQVLFGNAGALQILFQEGLCLEVFPENTVDDEYWRLLRPERSMPILL